MLSLLAVLAPPAVASETGSGFDSSNDTYAGTICEGLDPHALGVGGDFFPNPRLFLFLF